MRRAIVITLLAVSISACGSVQAMQQEQPLATATVTPRATMTAAPSYSMTPTIDYKQTAVVAEATSIAAMRLMVEVTAAQDARLFEQAAWTVTAEAINYQREVMTQQAAQFTATAYATSIPATQTRQAALDDMRATEMVMTIIAPTQIHAIAEAERFAEWADEREGVELLFKIALATILLGLGMFVAVMAVLEAIRFKKSEEDNDEPAEDVKPFARDVKNDNVLLPAVLPCSNDQLLELADGILNRGMTLSMNPWEGSAVHKSLKDIRAFFVQHHFAKVLVGKAGELGIEEPGHTFLADCLRLGSPPPPYQTAQ